MSTWTISTANMYFKDVSLDAFDGLSNSAGFTAQLSSNCSNLPLHVEYFQRQS